MSTGRGCYAALPFGLRCILTEGPHVLSQACLCTQRAVCLSSILSSAAGPVYFTPSPAVLSFMARLPPPATPFHSLPLLYPLLGPCSFTLPSFFFNACTKLSRPCPSLRTHFLELVHWRSCNSMSVNESWRGSMWESEKEGGDRRAEADQRKRGVRDDQKAVLNIVTGHMYIVGYQGKRAMGVQR